MNKNKKLFDHKEISKQITSLAKQINKDYKEKELICLCVLKGGFIFFSDLVKRITIPCQCDFVQVKSYKGIKSTNKIVLSVLPSLDLTNKDVLVVEDIVDTGQTMDFLVRYLKKKNPNSIKVCSLLEKPENRQKDIKIDYLGFTIPDNFVVGYGLDLDESYRNLPHIFSL